MTAYPKMTVQERRAEHDRLTEEFRALKARGLKLNMARGKPSAVQLDMVSDIFHLMQDPRDYMSDGIDVRSYGELRGLPAARRLFAEFLGCRPEQVFVGGNSSLQLMYAAIALAFAHGLPRSSRPWCREETVKWLCPVPGYDRHFKITESFGFQMIAIPMTDEGPDMDAVEEAVKDPAVKGIWCVPKFSNPEGIVYSRETVRRMASLSPAAPDFLVMWDNAYGLHNFEGEYEPFPDLLTECAKTGREDMVVEFCSTSKMTLPGAGVACFACSEANLAYFTKLLALQTIGFDKVNQQRHVLYLRDKAHTLELMARHGQILAPKFHAVLDGLDREIGPLEIASWHRPKGGYFISLDAMPGTAKRTLALCAEAGVTMTPAGATFPCGEDPRDSNIRISPSFPPVEELEEAIAVLCTCLKLSALEKLGV